MKWYTGGIAQAISVSKEIGAIFVVYIEGKDEQSARITSTIDEGELGQQLGKEHFVAIKLEAGSVPHQQFSEIYKATSVPSIYFIGKNGIPLDIITGNDSPEHISKRLEDILAKSGIVENKSVSIVSENIIPDDVPSVSSGSGDIVVCEDGLFTIKTDIASNEQAAVLSENEEKIDVSLEEKAKRAKELIEMKRQQKEREEKENERVKEIERRKMGQNAQQLKKWQEDQEMKQLKEDRDREKRENQLARDRVLAQIAQDRAERLSHTAQSLPVQTPKPFVTSAPKTASSTRLQFKLPDGSSNMQEFSNSDSLEKVISFIKANIKLPFNSFTLSTTFPRREFSTNDYSQSLLDLELTPNAVILILPTSGTVGNNPGRSLTALIWSLFAPIYGLFEILKSYIFGSDQNARSSISGNKRPPAESTETGTSNAAKRRVVRDSTVVKKDGNVHKLSDRNNDSDEDGNTWNGNSTQQM